MSANNQIDNNGSRGANSSGIGGKLMYLALGGGIGAALALLFAPKPGREFRRDIANTAVTGYDATLDAAGRVKEQAFEYLKMAKDKGSEMLDVVTEEASAIRHEITDDAARITGMAGRAARRAKQVF